MRTTESRVSLKDADQQPMTTSRPPYTVNQVSLLGIRVDAARVATLHGEIETAVQSEAHHLILNANVHCLNLAYRDHKLHWFLNSAQLVFCDGAGVQLGAAILGHRIPERITYADWIWLLADYAAPRHFSLFLLGARPGVADKAADRLREHAPDLRIVGTHHGYFDKTPGGPENESVIAQINAARPNILIVGFGMPLQEHWLMENWNRIDANIALTGGAVFDYVSGELRRAPKWMTKNGLEWLGRLIIEPQRLWKRYIIGNPLFLWRVLKQRFGLLRLD